MNPELSYIQMQCRSHELLRAAQSEHRFEAAPSRSRPAPVTRALNLRMGLSWRGLITRRPAIGKV